MIDSLPSYWRGTTFRSRTEARWAVFFDAIGLRWEYEPEGFRLQDGTWYLPDFWLPDMECWAEVKGAGPTAEERSKVEMLVEGSGHECLMLPGAPWPQVYDLCRAESDVGVAWWDVCFNDKHTVGRHDGPPRLYYQPAPYEAEDQEMVSEAMATARRIDLTEPEAGDYLPMGWEGIEPVLGDAPEPVPMDDYLPWGERREESTDADDTAA